MDPIDRDEAIKRINHQRVVDKSVARRILYTMPSVKSEIINCKDCGHAEQEEKDGWISIVYGMDEKNTPPEGKYILLSFSNFDLPVIGRYEGGAFYDGDNDQPLASYGVFVNAWQPLPGPYREEGEA